MKAVEDSIGWDKIRWAFITLIYKDRKETRQDEVAWHPRETRRRIGRSSFYLSFWGRLVSIECTDRGTWFPCHTYCTQLQSHPNPPMHTVIISWYSQIMMYWESSPNDLIDSALSSEAGGIFCALGRDDNIKWEVKEPKYRLGLSCNCKATSVWLNVIRWVRMSCVETDCDEIKLDHMYGWFNR